MSRFLPCLPCGRGQPAGTATASAGSSAGKQQAVTHSWGPKSKNQRIKALVDVLCSLMADEKDATLTKDFDSVLQDAKNVVDEEIVDIIVSMTRKIRMSQILGRFADRKRPDVYVYNWIQQTKDKGKKELAEAKQLRDEKLQALVGGEEPTKNIWRMCNSSGWSQQNLYDWLGSQGGYLTGAAIGYAEAAEKDRLWSEFYARRLGFDEYPPKLSKNQSVLALCDTTCRLWTMEHCPNGPTTYKFEGKPRLACFNIAVAEAKECLPQNLTELLVNMAAQQRREVFESRNGSLHRVAHVAGEGDDVEMDRSGAEGNSKGTLQRIRDLLGYSSLEAPAMVALSKVSYMAAWQEQHLLESDSTTILDVKKVAKERQTRAQQCKEQKEAASLRLGLDTITAAGGGA